MNRARPVIVILLLIAVGVAAWLIFGRSEKQRYLSGYVEGESLFLAAPVAGTVGSISAVEGARVQAGQPLFSIDPATLSAQGSQARAQIAEARTQTAAAAANAQQAESEARAAGADAEKAQRDLNRLLSVRRDDPAAVAGKDIDAARAALREANARLSAARDLANARRSQIASAQAQVEQARSGEREVQIKVGQLAPAAPATGLIENVYFQRGEWVSANQPVVSILPDDRVKLRFFVPETEVDRYKPGTTVRFSCDNCASGLTARISHVASRPEFTPPVIFSRDSRDRLVFMVEALPAKAANLRPGLPIDVEPLP
jgi:HlyD family secretion protein